MSALVNGRRASSPLPGLQSSSADDKHARLAGTAIILLRSVIVAACIMFVLHKLAIRPGLITTIMPGAAFSVAVWMVGSRFDSRMVNTVASAFDMGLISICVYFSGGLTSEAYALYFVALCIIALQDSAISSSVGSILCALLYAGAAFYTLAQERQRLARGVRVGVLGEGLGDPSHLTKVTRVEGALGRAERAHGVGHPQLCCTFRRVVQRKCRPGSLPGFTLAIPVRRVGE